MKQLVFLYNFMISDKWQEKSKLPLTFISFGFVEGKLYRIDDNYILVDKASKKHKWNDDRVYGGLYILDNAEYYLRVLDGIMGCSLTSLRKNHKMDYMHRIKMSATPIHFKTITEFAQMKFEEKDKIECIAYVSNLDNKFINYKVNNTFRNRAKYGFDEFHYINLLKKYKTMKQEEHEKNE